MSQEAELSTKNPVTVHLLSDRTGELLDDIWPRIRERFPENGFAVKRYHKESEAMRLTEARLDGFIRDIINTPGRNVVYYTVESEARAALIKAALQPLKIECVDPLAEGVRALAKISGQTPMSRGLTGSEEERVARQMVAMRFWQTHDDGLLLDDVFASGHILLVAQSRVGKSGACAFLAMDGLRVGNLPFVQEVADPENLKRLMSLHPNVHVVALTRDVTDLSALRRRRMEVQLADKSFAEGRNPQRWREAEEKYFGIPAIARETQAFTRFCRDAGLTMTVDATRCQPEEVAARVVAKIKEDHVLVP